MGLSIQHNDDGSITIGAGDDRLRVLPGEARGTTGGDTHDATSPAAGTAAAGDQPWTPPVIVDPDDPLVGWPGPSAPAFAAPDVPHVRALYDRASESLRVHPSTYDAVRQYRQTGAGAAIPVAVVSRINEPVDLQRLAPMLRQLQVALGGPIVPYLARPDDADPAP